MAKTFYAYRGTNSGRTTILIHPPRGAFDGANIVVHAVVALVRKCLYFVQQNVGTNNKTVEEVH